MHKKKNLTKRGTSIEEINTKLQANFDKGYSIKVDESDANKMIAII